MRAGACSRAPLRPSFLDALDHACARTKEAYAGPPWVEPVPGEPLTFHTVGQKKDVRLVPLHAIHGERYAVYWKVNKKSA